MLLSAAIFTFRGPLRANGHVANDFAAPYTSARLWIQHQNPYDPASFWIAWHTAGAPTGKVYANPSSTHSVYPPPSVVALAPFAYLPWTAAWRLFISFSTLLYLAALLWLARTIPGDWSTCSRLAFLILGLQFAPPLSALHVSNVTCLSGSLALIGTYLLVGGDESALSTAAIFALSICIKPTLAPVVLVYLVYLKAWKTFTATLALTTFVTAIFPFLQPDWAWLASLRSNIDFLFTAGVADLDERNLTRSDRIDLQLPAYSLTHSREAAALIAAVIAIALLVLVWRFSTRFLVPDDPARVDRRLLVLSTLLVIGLLPFYQRFYSAIVLLAPMVWAIRNLAMSRARWVLALCGVFLVNTSVLPRRLNFRLPPAGLSHVLAETFITDHLCWLLLALALLLLNTLAAAARPQPAPNEVH